MNTAGTRNYPKRLNWSVKQISVLLTVIALLLWSHSILYARFEVGYFGLIHGLPITFFIALGILTIASAILWVSKERHEKLLCFQLLFLITALWLTPALIGTHPGLGGAYRNLGLISGIAEQGKVFHTWYLSWPGSHILFAMIAKLGAVDFEPILGVFPFFMQLFYLLPLYVFLSNVLGDARINYCWLGLWLFSLANWIGQDYFSPQAIAFFLMLTLLALITSPSLWEGKSRPFAFWLIAALIIAAATTIHLLTSLAIFCILAAFCLAKRAKTLALVTALCLLLIVCWDITGGAHYITSRALSQPLVTPTVEAPTPTVEPPTPTVEPQKGILIFDPDYIVETNITRFIRGSESHIAVVQTRILFSLIFTLLGVTGAILALVLAKPKKTNISVLAMVVVLQLLLLLSNQMTSELIQRVYLYSLPFMAYFVVLLLVIGKRTLAIVLCFILIAAVPLHIVAHYGNQALDYWPPSSVAGLHRIEEIRKCNGYPIAGVHQLYSQDSQLVFKENFPKEEHYFVVDQRYDAKYEFLHDQPEFVDRIQSWLDSSDNYNLIYVNPEFSLYIHEEEGE